MNQQERALTTNQKITHPAIITMNSKMKGLNRESFSYKQGQCVNTQAKFVYNILFSQVFLIPYPKASVLLNLI